MQTYPIELPTDYVEMTYDEDEVAKKKVKLNVTCKRKHDAKTKEVASQVVVVASTPSSANPSPSHMVPIPSPFVHNVPPITGFCALHMCQKLQ